MDAVLPLWKERGMTSHDCVMQVRKIMKTKKVGHTGTLDPDVEGVLPICIGKATKVIEYMMESGKSYKGEVTIGYSTTTEDKSGELVEQRPVAEPVNVEEIDKAMEQLEGVILQVPPMYSAIKVKGRRLYEYARKGEEVERPQREVAIHLFKRISEPVYDPLTQIQKWRFEVQCGKGTYVRTLAVDLGRILGFPAHMSDLIRTGSGGFTETDCYTLSEVAAFSEKGVLAEKLYPLERGIKHFPRYDLPQEIWEKVKHGALLEEDQLQYAGVYPAVFYYQEKAVAVYDRHPSKKGLLKPSKMFRTDV